MNNNHTQDFYVEVIRARGSNPNLTLEDVWSSIQAGTFEYKAFGISKEVANTTAERAFKVGGVVGLPESGAGSVGYNSIGGFVDETLQVGVLDTPKTVTFGAGGTTSDGSVTIAANGEITLNTLEYLSIKQRFRAGRTGAAAQSDVFFWAEASFDGGTTWNVIGNSVDIALDSAKETTVFFDISNVYLPAGTMLRNRFARSSTGDDSGDLQPATPSAALTALGVLIAPSAQITLYKV